MNGITERFEINVGGTIFVTTRDTLNKSEFLYALLNHSEIDNILFIDRDPTGFKHVLRFLRDNRYNIPNKWRIELDFYCPNVESKEKTNFIDTSNYNSMIFKRIENIRSGNLQPKYLDTIVKFNRDVFYNNRSEFKLVKFYDAIIYIAYDFITGPIHSGAIEDHGNPLFTFGATIPFPKLYMCAIQFSSNLKIVMHGDVNEIFLSIRKYISFNHLIKFHQDSYIDAEHNFIYNRGSLTKIYLSTPEWLQESI